MDIVITGTGIISPAGIGAGPVIDAMIDGEHFFDRDQPGKRSLHPKFPWPEASLPDPDVPWPEGRPWADIKKYANVSAHQAVGVSRMAIDQSGLATPEDATRCGCVVASGNRIDELGSLIARLGTMAETDPRPLAKLLFDEVPDYSYLRGIPCQIGQFICLAAGFEGSNVAAYGEAGACGLGALAFALRMLQSEELDRVIVTGVGIPVSPAILVGMDSVDPLGTEAIAGRGPFDVHRRGGLLGQAAAAIVIERADTAARRGAAPLARLLACECINAESQEIALDLAVRMTLAEAQAAPSTWWTHGSGSVEKDQIEIEIAGPLIRAPATSSKGTIGNAFEASALVDIVLAIEALNRGVVPPVTLLRTPDPVFADTDFVVGTARRQSERADTALITALDQRVACAGAAMISRMEN